MGGGTSVLWLGDKHCATQAVRKGAPGVLWKEIQEEEMSTGILSLEHSPDRQGRLTELKGVQADLAFWDLARCNNHMDFLFFHHLGIVPGQ